MSIERWVRTTGVSLGNLFYLLEVKGERCTYVCSLPPLASYEKSKELSFSSGKGSSKEDKEPSSSWIRSILEDFFMKEREFS